MRHFKCYIKVVKVSFGLWKNIFFFATVDALKKQYYLFTFVFVGKWLHLMFYLFQCKILAKVKYFTENIFILQCLVCIPENAKKKKKKKKNAGFNKMKEF